MYNYRRLSTRQNCGKIIIKKSSKEFFSMATKLKQKRKSGFLARKRTKAGRKILQRRRRKGRKKLAV
jgi:large subunit ribosomal protein L34